MIGNRLLCVAEKPSVAKELAAILSGAHANPIRTHSVYNPKFEFSYDLDGRQCQLIITRCDAVFLSKCCCDDT